MFSLASGGRGRWWTSRSASASRSQSAPLITIAACRTNRSLAGHLSLMSLARLGE
jgi:hypothetical protein